ncbi:tyrosine-type recombinase/integrase [Shinella sp. S4-D37]|uniref:tyrosine-type recombinase/integrase n=1 Tax=Shinella sp. S4-D37 TaxID=3161999 RepID=UPI0034675B91
MPTIKLTRKAVAAIEAAAKATTYYDTDVKGFGLKVMPSGARSWILEYRPGVGGRSVSKKRIKIGTPATHSPEEARDEAAKTLARVTLGADPAAARAEERAAMTVKEVAESYLDKHVSEKRKGNTERLYRWVLNDHVLPAIGSMRASQVTRADVTRMQASITRGRKDLPNGGRTTANRALAVLGAMFNWAAGEGLVPEGFNPVPKVERYRENQKERYLSSEELAALGAALTEAETTGLPYDVDETKPTAKHAPKQENRVTVFSPHVTGAIRLLVLTGCRLREILDLRWTDIDFDRGLLLLSDSKTGKKVIVASTAAIDVLTALPRVGRYVIASSSAGTENERPRHDLKKPWEAIRARAGLEGVRLHDLRHSFASVGAGSGLGLPILGKLLGHSQAATTARYAHLDADPVRRAADVIADRIATAMGGK